MKENKLLKLIEKLSNKADIKGLTTAEDELLAYLCSEWARLYN